MSNKIKKLISLGIILMSAFGFSAKKVQAASFYEAEWIPNNYLKLELNGVKKYMQAEFFRRQSDKAFVYCLEPFIKIQPTANYSEITTNHHNYLSVTKKEWERITALAYYGYMYQNHTEDKWYVITQVLIWKTVNKNYKINFTDKLNGNILNNAYKNEIDELESLVAKHNLEPDLSQIPKEISYQDNITIEDKNHILRDYTITDSNIDVTITNDTLTITGNKIGPATIVLVKENNLYSENPTLYLSENSQTVFRLGSLAKQTITINLEVKGPTLKIVKKDYDTKAIIKQANIQFKIKNLTTNEYLVNPANKENPHIFLTDTNGEIVIPNLNFGSYAISEESKIPGYKKQEKPQLLELTPTSKYQNINNELIYEEAFYNKRITGTIKVTKLGEEAFDAEKYTALQGVKIGLYAKENIYDINGNLIYPKNKQITTALSDKQGNLTFSNLYLGKYYLKELETLPSYVLDEKEYSFELNDTTSNSTIKSIKLINYLKKGQVILTKKDSLSKEIISGVKINLYNEDNTLIDQGITNEEGQIIIKNLPLGTYYFEEIEAIPGYVLNNQKTYFTLKENNDQANITLENDPIIEIPDTYSSKDFYYLEGVGVLMIICLIYLRKHLIF